MKIIKTKSYKQALTDYQIGPPIYPSSRDRGPARTMLVDDNDSKEKIKKEWLKKKRTTPKVLIYQNGIVVPGRGRNLEQNS